MRSTRGTFRQADISRSKVGCLDIISKKLVFYRLLGPGEKAESEEGVEGQSYPVWTPSYVKNSGLKGIQGTN